MSSMGQRRSRIFARELLRKHHAIGIPKTQSLSALGRAAGLRLRAIRDQFQISRSFLLPDEIDNRLVKHQDFGGARKDWRVRATD